MSTENFLFLSANGQKIYSFLNKFFIHEKNKGILEIEAKIQNIDFHQFYQLKTFIDSHPVVKHIEKSFEIDKFDAYNRRLTHNHMGKFLYVIKKEKYETIILENNVKLSASSEEVVNDFDDNENGFVRNKNRTSYFISSFLRIDFTEIIQAENCTKYEIEIEIVDFHKIATQDMEIISNDLDHWLKILVKVEKQKNFVEQKDFDHQGFDKLYDVFIKSTKRSKSNIKK